MKKSKKLTSNDKSDLINITENYSMIEEVGSGTCGEVFKGMDNKTGQIVAMKRIKILHQEEEGFPRNSLLEIKFLRNLSHENIIKLIKVEMSQDRKVYLIFDYCEYDLHCLLSQISLTKQQTKCYFKQILLALQACSQQHLIHRDMKPSNILLTTKNVVKLCDFGLAKEIETNSNKPQTSKVITIWYRPPELLLGATRYGTEIDIWSSGCILYEMITRNVLFRSNFDNEFDEISAIFHIHGIPTDEEWPNWKTLPSAELFIKNKNLNVNISINLTFKKFLEKTLPAGYDDAIDLIIKMLQYNPTSRISADEALNHPFITKDYEECLPEKLPEITLPSFHKKPTSRKKSERKSKKSEIDSLRAQKKFPPA